jgi:hypothetical protein
VLAREPGAGHNGAVNAWTAAGAPPTTIAPLGTVPSAPSTVPFTTRPPSAHISPVFPALSGAGFFVLLVLVALQWRLTRPGRRGRTL